MGFLSCLGCGSSSDEKPTSPDAKEKIEKETTPIDGSGNIERTEEELKAEQTQNVPEVFVEQNRDDLSLASVTMNSPPSDMPPAPEESFGSRFLIPEDGLRHESSHGSSQHSRDSLDPRITEEDRWFDH